ncbi:FAD-dependent oxidoreductase [Nocardia sp. NPDC050193]
MHQVAAGQQLIDFRIPDLLSGTGVDFHRAAATAIDTATRTVSLDDGAVLPYDRLVYALGSTTDTSSVPGAANHAWTLDNRLVHITSRSGCPKSPRWGGTVTVCGGGLTGIEAAAEIAEAHPGPPLSAPVGFVHYPRRDLGTGGESQLGEDVLDVPLGGAR